METLERRPIDPQPEPLPDIEELIVLELLDSLCIALMYQELVERKGN